MRDVTINIQDACQKLVDRIGVYKMANPGGTWKDWVSSAYADRVSLSATGFYRLESYIVTLPQFIRVGPTQCKP